MEKNYITLTTEQLAQMSASEKVQKALKIAEHYHYPQWMKNDIKATEKYWDDPKWEDMRTIIEEMLTADYPFTANVFLYAIQLN